MARQASLFDKYSARLLDTAPPVAEKPALSRAASKVLQAQQSSGLYNESKPASSMVKKDTVASLGKGWFDLKPMKMDEKLQQDIDVIRMRNFLDPKRFYKNPDKIGAVLGVGTVVEGSTEYKSARLSRKERKESVLDEVLADRQLRDYNKKTFMKIQQEKGSKKKAYKTKRQQKH